MTVKTEMTKKERVLAALENKAVDKVPMGFWYHFSPDDDFKEETVQAHLNWFKEAKLDFIKIMCDGFFGYPNPTLKSVKTPEDLYQIQPLGADHPFIQDQIWRAKRIVDELQGEACTFYNVFCPMSQMRFGTDDLFLMNMIRQDPKAVAHALKVISEDTKALIHGLICDAGIDGIYYCVQNAEMKRFSAREYMELVTPAELDVLEYANTLSYHNILHCCGWAGDKNRIEVWKNYPAACINWAVYVEGLSMKDGKEFFGGKCVLGGFDNTPRGLLYSGTIQQIKEETFRILDEVGTTGVMLGADCTIPADMDLSHLLAVEEARNEYALRA